MDKRSLRGQYLSKRKALSKEIHQKKSEAIADLVLKTVSQGDYRSLHTFLPIKKNHEVDTYPLIRRIREQNPKLVLVVPRTFGSDLEHYVLSETTLIEPGPYSVPEPQSAKPFGDQQIDIALVPLLIFDLQGHRLGYGKGYYDRFLAKYPGVLKIGLSLFPPIDQIPEITSKDVPLDMVITPEKVYRFT